MINHTLLNPACGQCYKCGSTGTCQAAKQYFYDQHGHRELSISGGPSTGQFDDWLTEFYACDGGFGDPYPSIPLPPADLSGTGIIKTINRDDSACGYSGGAGVCPPYGPWDFGAGFNYTVWKMPRYPAEYSCGNGNNVVGIGMNLIPFGLGRPEDCEAEGYFQQTTKVEEWLRIGASIEYGWGTSGPYFVLNTSVNYTMLGLRQGAYPTPGMPLSGGNNWSYEFQFTNLFTGDGIHVWTKTNTGGDESSVVQTYKGTSNTTWNGYFFSSTSKNFYSGTPSLDLWVPDPVIDPAAITEVGPTVAIG